jgi:hypothetical protein
LEESVKNTPETAEISHWFLWSVDLIFIYFLPIIQKAPH